MTDKVNEVRNEINKFAARKYMDAIFEVEITKINEELIRDNYRLLNDISSYLKYDFCSPMGMYHFSIDEDLEIHNGFFCFWYNEFIKHLKPDDFKENPLRVKGLITLRHAANMIAIGNNPYNALKDYQGEFENLKIIVDQE